MSEWGYRFTHFLIRLLCKATVRLEVIGVENIPRSGAYVIVSNHLGRLDPPLIYYYLKRRDIVMLVAEKYRRVPGIPWLVRQLGGLFVDRFNADFATVREALGRLKQGAVLVLAPEGTRSKTEALLPGQPGAAYLAAKANTLILPGSLTGTEDRLVLRSLLRLRRAHVIVRVGKPFTLPPLPSKDREAALAAYTEEIMARIAVTLPPQYRGVYADHPRLKELLAEQIE